MIRKAVIPAAGLGTRLLSTTKELPKEMLPIFCKNNNNEIYLKPLLQIIFEKLYKEGIKDFCFIIGRGKRAIEDHFTPDYHFLEILEKKGKTNYVKMLREFYSYIENSNIIWINQSEPLGFGHAVYLSKPFMRDETFLVMAGDTYINTKNGKSFIKEMIEKHLSSHAVATLLLQYVENPKEYGVAVINENRVEKVVEKPKEFVSNYIILPVYIFEPIIYNALESIDKGYGGEIQLTDAIQKLISWGLKVQYVLLDKDDARLDIGNPESYYDALIYSFSNFLE